MGLAGQDSSGSGHPETASPRRSAGSVSRRLGLTIHGHEDAARVNVRWVTPLGEETASTS